MEAQEATLPTLDQVIGERVRDLRERLGWTQDELAMRLRETGFETWSRVQVAAVEANPNVAPNNPRSRIRRILASDLFAFANAFACSVDELIAPPFIGEGLRDEGRRVRLGPNVSAVADANELADAVTSYEAPFPEIGRIAAPVPVSRRRGLFFESASRQAEAIAAVFPTAATEEEIASAAWSDFSMKLALPLDLSGNRAVHACRIAHCLWGRFPLEERRARIEVSGKSPQRVHFEMAHELKLELEQRMPQIVEHMRGQTARGKGKR